MSENTSPETEVSAVAVEEPTEETEAQETATEEPKEEPTATEEPKTLAQTLVDQESADADVASVQEPEAVVESIATVSADATLAAVKEREATEVYQRIAEACVQTRLRIIRKNGKPDYAGATQLYKWWYATAITAQWVAAKVPAPAQTRMRNAIAQHVRRTYLPAAVEEHVKATASVVSLEENPETGETETISTPVTETENPAEAIKAAILREYTSADLDHPTLTPTASKAGTETAARAINPAQGLSNMLGTVSAMFDKVPARYLAIALDRFTSDYVKYLQGEGAKVQDPEASKLAWQRIAARAGAIGQYMDGKLSPEDFGKLPQYDPDRHGKL